MKRKSAIFLSAAVTVAAIFVFVFTLVNATLYAPDTEVAAPALVAEAVGAKVPPERHPSRLSIPALKINASVQSVGVNAKGNMAAPSNFTDVAWYKYGFVPGQQGNAVVAGHVDNGLGLSGVFKRLKDLKVGDDVYIERKDGAKLHFVVVEVKSYPYKEVPLEKLFGNSNKAMLNLISCEGAWIKTDKTYDKRLVVFTELRDIQQPGS